VDWLVHRLELNDAQKASFKEFQDARTQSLSDSKAKLCASKPDLSSFEGRLVFGQAFLEARLDAVKAENPKLIAFYNSLDERQKRIFDEIRAHSHRR
jgi:LTXXQ motif family protein